MNTIDKIRFEKAKAIIEYTYGYLPSDQPKLKKHEILYLAWNSESVQEGIENVEEIQVRFY